MSTNYYAIDKETVDKLETAKINSLSEVYEANLDHLTDMIEEYYDNRMPEKIHIGKQSMGWQFAFDHNDWKYFDKSKKSILNFLSKCKLYNEYDDEVDLSHILQLVEDNKNMINNEQYYSKNRSLYDNSSFLFKQTEFGEFYIDDLLFIESTGWC